MRLSLFGKLFLTILAAVVLAVAMVMVFVNWRFRLGFVDYLHRDEQHMLERLADRLIERYDADPAWRLLRQHPEQWSHWLRQQAHPPQAASPAPPPRRRHRPPSLQERIVLYDAEGRWLMGAREAMRPGGELPPHVELYRLPLHYGDERVGYVGVLQKQRMDRALADTFLHQQMQGLVWPLVFALLLAFALAAILVRRILRPIHALTRGTQALTQGDYQQQIEADSGDELARLSEDFNQLAAALARQTQLRQQWLTDISHELRTPIGVLRAELEALQDGLRQPTPERIDALHHSVLCLGHLVDDLHQLSVSDAGLWESPSDTVCFGDVLNTLIQSHQVQCQQAGLALQGPTQELSALWLRADRARLYQLFSSLLDNSLRYTDAPGQIQIDVAHRPTAGELCIRFEDSPPGVSDEDLPRLFQRLFRVDRSRSRAFGGSGLGLSIAQNIVELHAGRIEAQHSALGGVCICVYLPVLEEDA